MKLFPEYKKSKVGYFVYDDILHKSMYQEMYKVNKNTFSCPAVSSLNNRMFQVNNFMNVQVEFGVKNGEPFYEYNFNTKENPDTANIHDVLNDRLSVRLDSDGCAVLQMTDTKIFVTDTKDLELIVLQPTEYVETSNANFISGTFNIYGWLRPINSAYVQIDKSKTSKGFFSNSKPIYTVLFNKPVNLYEIEPNQKILDYVQYTYGISNYQRHFKKVFYSIIKKRPKDLLNET